ncbi:2,3-diaminopropionate biosynthesis protein SbnA [Paenibacillus arenilitoris]|uniref:2,3-diaminopropionate biosynthesis protein SbnA n=1 Tax=Paenibacillus arenilitoris TaxID=2772299 RepID=A0A927H851_9BACL|nr:2,3-diaminopropionate biosynthesis protein SbnA [Paenibacillus arenilitoris]MBD2871323.1 2,3-diaminopropionate biosynthesis protein SbnA [Paenibacillus arenilitoris]
MAENMLSIIGNTPLVRLSKLFANDRGIQVYAKLELLNPNGSAKDRSAARIIASALEQGHIGPGSVIVESSSGNMAISLAAICSYLGMRFICVIDPKTSGQNVRIMQAYGAEIERVDEPDPATGEFLPARLHRVRQLLSRIPGSYWPNQYENENNYMSHYDGTMREIADSLGVVDYVVGGVSTCGTMLGCAQYARDHQLPAKIVAVDAAGSVIFGGAKGYRRFPGLGAGIVPPFGQTRFMDYAFNITDLDMVIGCRELVRHESIMAGPSSGAVISALKQLMPGIPDHSVCVVILHDRGERYMDTVYSDEWVEQQFGRDSLRERGYS